MCLERGISAQKEEASFAQRVLAISSTNVFLIGKGGFSVIWAFCTQWKTGTEDRGKDEHFCYQASSILQYFAASEIGTLEKEIRHSPVLK